MKQYGIKHVDSLFEKFRLHGEPVQNFEFFSRAWDECAELQCTPKQDWIGRNLLSLQALDRYEIAIVRQGEFIGGLILAEDFWDVHVGPCMSVFAQYVLPEYRNTGVSAACMRAALRIARKAGAPTLAFTHRKGPWRYETVYRSLHEATQDRHQRH